MIVIRTVLLWALVVLASINAARSTAAQEPPTSPPPRATSPETLDGRDGRDLLLRSFRPQPMLKTPRTPLAGAKRPVVDIHTHFRYRLLHDPQRLDEFVELMDRQNIAVCVSLDGGLGEDFREHADYLWSRYPHRFAIFANIDWCGDGRPGDPATWDCQQEGFAARIALQLKEARQRGACGLKVFKRLGLGYRNPDGSLVTVDDPRWDPIWKACGDLGLPVLIHTADPAAFFLDIDANNERWEELYRHPEWRFPADKFPSRRELLDARNRVIERHPQTTFVGAHVANNPEDLQAVRSWLDRYPNLYVDIASRIGELGRQPYRARQFLMEYADRVVFGTDGPWPETRVTLYWRFLETWDENFPYSEKEFPPQGFWRIFGTGLPDDVLEKIYFANALRIVPGLRQKYEAATAKRG